MKSYTVAHQDLDKIVVEGRFENFADATIFLSSSIYIDPFIVIDDGTLDLENMPPEEVRKHALQHIEFQMDS